MANRPLVVTIGGGSGSGKTTLAIAIAKALVHRQVLVLHEDDYYHDHGANPTFVAADFNFDDIRAHDHTLLIEHIQQLRANGQIPQLKYDFLIHRREPITKLLGPAHIILIEDIHVLYSEVIRSLTDLSVYIEVPDDVRLLRRLLRDIVARGREPASLAAQYLNMVRPMHYLYTYPGRFAADFVLHDDGNHLTKRDVNSNAQIQQLIALLLNRLGELSN